LHDEHSPLPRGGDGGDGGDGGGEGFRFAVDIADAPDGGGR